VLPQPKPRIWPVFVTLLVALVVATVLQVVLVAVLVAIELSRGTDVKSATDQLLNNLLTDPTVFILLAACGQVAFLLAAIVPAWLSPVPLRERLGLVPTKLAWPVYPLTTLGSMFPLAIGMALGYALTLVLPADDSVQKLFDNMQLWHALPFVLFIAFVPAVSEELLFRGYMQRRLLERWTPFWAVGVTSVIFAIMHVTPHAIVALLPVAIYFGIVGWRAGSVLPTICCHAWINGSLNAWRMVAKFGGVSGTLDTVVYSAATLLGAICFFWSFRYLFAATSSTADSLTASEQSPLELPA
jgi:membrane protease YdiL (CAAX protease family)